MTYSLGSAARVAIATKRRKPTSPRKNLDNRADQFTDIKEKFVRQFQIETRRPSPMNNPKDLSAAQPDTYIPPCGHGRRCDWLWLAHTASSRTPITSRSESECISYMFTRLDPVAFSVM